MTEYQSHSPTSTGPEAPAPKRLTRSTDDKVLGGVCGGLAAYFDVDANLLRILLVAATVFGFGAGVILYIAAWALLPTY